MLNVDKNYVQKIEDLEWIAGAREAIKLCNDLGYLTLVVTNRSGVARGYFGIDAVHRLHDWMNNQLAKIGVHIDEFRYCRFHEGYLFEGGDLADFVLARCCKRKLEHFRASGALPSGPREHVRVDRRAFQTA
nr:HAD-IIIA family hydrolase [Bradyrhizobium elkanii]